MRSPKTSVFDGAELMHIAMCGPISLDRLDYFPGTVLTTNGYPFPGTANLVKRYLKAGNQVTVVTTAPDVVSTITLRGPNLTVLVVPSRRRALHKIRDFFRYERVGITNALASSGADVIHAHWTYEFGLAARKVRIPSLVTVHDWAPRVARFNRHPYWYLRALMQVRCLTSNGALSAPTEYISQLVRKIYRRHCITIPNGIDISAFQNTSDSSKTAAPLNVGMLNVGFSDLKNVKAALSLWPAVMAEFPDAVLRLAGPDYERNGAAHTWATEQGLTAGVVFEGPIGQNDLPTWFKSKNIFLHMSREESFGMVLVEAMASGVPVIAGRMSGAVAEVTRGAADLVDIDDFAAVSNTIIALHRDPSAVEWRRQAGLEAAKTYDLDIVASEYLRVLSFISKMQD